MRKSFRIYAWAWVGVLSATLLFMAIKVIVAPSHHGLARDPYNVEKIIDVDLPRISYVDSEDNMDRGASCWDCYSHYVQFCEPLSAECVEQLEALCEADPVRWSKSTNYGYYQYNEEGELYSLDCTIYDDHSCVVYYVEETEGLFILLPFVLVYMALFAWGAVLFIIWLVCRAK